MNQTRTDTHGHHWQDGICLGCDEVAWGTAALKECPNPVPRVRRQERLEALADSGCDSWEEARCER